MEEDQKPKRRSKLRTVSVCLLAIILIAVFVIWPRLKAWGDRWRYGTAVVSLASAVMLYQEEYGRDLPDRLETILDTGLFGLDRNYDVQDGRIRIFGYPVTYLKADGEGFVVAVFDEVDGDAGFVVSGDPSSYIVRGYTLQYILRVDEKLRKEANQPLWAKP